MNTVLTFGSLSQGKEQENPILNSDFRSENIPASKRKQIDKDLGMIALVPYFFYLFGRQIPAALP